MLCVSYLHPRQTALHWRMSHGVTLTTKTGQQSQQKNTVSGQNTANAPLEPVRQSFNAVLDI